MLKKELNHLASKYRRRWLKNKDMRFKEIYKCSHIQKIIRGYGRKFRSWMSPEDVDSIALEALLKALNNYNINLSSFTTHYIRWFVGMLQRELIKVKYDVLKMPENLGKKAIQLSPQDVRDLEDGKGEDLIDKYSLTKYQYNQLTKYYKNFNLEMYQTSHTNLNVDLMTEIDLILDNVPTEYRKPIIFYYGLLGVAYSAADIEKNYNVKMSDIIDYLTGNEDLISLLGGYNG